MESFLYHGSTFDVAAFLGSQRHTISCPLKYFCETHSCICAQSFVPIPIPLSRAGLFFTIYLSRFLLFLTFWSVVSPWSSGVSLCSTQRRAFCCKMSLFTVTLGELYHGIVVRHNSSLSSIRLPRVPLLSFPFIPFSDFCTTRARD